MSSCPVTARPHHLETGHAAPDLFCQLDLRLARGAVRPAAGGGLLDGLQHGRMRVAEDQRSPGADVIEVFAAVDVGEARAMPMRDKKGRSADSPERPYG